MACFAEIVAVAARKRRDCVRKSNVRPVMAPDESAKTNAQIATGGAISSSTNARTNLLAIWHQLSRLSTFSGMVTRR